MRTIEAQKAEAGFDLVATTARSQGATLVLEPGQRTGGPDYATPTSDQWLTVLAGEGEAVVDGRHVPLHPGLVLLIEAGERHEVSNTGPERLVTWNVYALPNW